MHNIMNYIKWISFVLIVLMGLILFYPSPQANTNQQEIGSMYVSITCTTDARGVTFCRDRKTGRTWTINPSPVGTSIRT